MRLLFEAKFETPVKGPVTSGYGPRTILGKRQNHYGIDIAVPSNTEIKSPLDGTVIASMDGAGKCGGLIEILHNTKDKQITTLYCHLNKRKVKKGDVVYKGDVIGFTGGETDAPVSKKGNSLGPHLHLGVSEVENGVKKKVNPMLYLDKDFDMGIDLEKPEWKEKIEKIGDVEVDGKKLKDIVKTGKTKVKSLSNDIISKILKFIGLKESEINRKLLEEKIIEKLKNKKTLK